MKKTKAQLELRMYFFTIYQLMGIQKGIQSGHSLGEYLLQYGRYNSDHIVWDFLEKYKTFILLDGGTTNDDKVEMISIGSLNQIYEQLEKNLIEFSAFREPDLNKSLTAVCFICDERVFNYEDYPDFPVYMKDKIETIKWLETFKNGKWTYEEMREKFPIEMKNWINDVIGGEKNLFLRELIRNKKLA